MGQPAPDGALRRDASPQIEENHTSGGLRLHLFVATEEKSPSLFTVNPFSHSIICSIDSTMLALETAEKTEITLQGSVEIVSEFFFTAINSILYQRGT